MAGSVVTVMLRLLYLYCTIKQMNNFDGVAESSQDFLDETPCTRKQGSYEKLLGLFQKRLPLAMEAFEHQ